MKKVSFALLLVLLALLLMGAAKVIDARKVALARSNMRAGWTQIGGGESPSQTSRNFMDGQGRIVRVFARVFSSPAEAREVWEEEFAEGVITRDRPAPLIAVDDYGRSQLDLGQILVLKGNVIAGINFDWDAGAFTAIQLKCERIQIQRIVTPGKAGKCPLTALK